MKILHTVECYAPARGGMAEVVRQLSERLAALGHEVTVATRWQPERPAGRYNGVEVVPFEVAGNTIKGLEGDVTGYQDFLLESRFDVVTNFAAQQWATDIALPLLPLIAGRKVFVPTGFSGLFSRSYRDYFDRMPEFMRHYDMNVFHSDSYRDIVFARKHGIANLTVIPNGAAASEFLAPFPEFRARSGIPSDHFLILHVGSHTWLKGHEEAMEIFLRADLRDATFLLVGSELEGGCGRDCHQRAGVLNASRAFRDARKKIMVRDLSRADTVAAYHAADLFLFPSQIECSPIVLFECLASRTPFLATNVGNSAEIINWTDGAGVLLPSASTGFLPQCRTLRERLRRKLEALLGRVDDFRGVYPDLEAASATLTALTQDAKLRNEMARRGFAAWQRRFTWENIAREYDALYRRLAEERLA